MSSFIGRQSRRMKKLLIGTQPRTGPKTQDSELGLPEASLSWAVREALALSEADLEEPRVNPSLLEGVGKGELPANPVQPEDLFFLDGVPLPCWEETHLTLYGDWLTAADNYPVYYELFRRLTREVKKTRLLEIGVFTGYSGTVFARAAKGPTFYFGVDPNVYLSYGLQLASRTFKTLRLTLEDFDFCLLEGYSWDPTVQHSIIYSGPFDIVHVDGDHTLVGKLVDLELARQVIAKDGLVLVDDYDYHPCVSDAIQRALKLGWFKEFAHVPKMRGLAVLRC